MAQALETRDEQLAAHSVTAGDARTARAAGPTPVATAQGRGASLDAAGRQQPTVAIGAGCSFTGLMTFHGSTQLDGEFVGEVIATGRLHLGVTARVRASIEVDELIVDVVLEGDVVARHRIVLSASARVRGSIQAPWLSLAEGCTFQGRCRCTPRGDR